MRLAGNLHAELLLGLTLRAAGAVASFALVWIIARTFGATTVGLFQVALATATLAAIIVVQGLDRIIVRMASVAISRGSLDEAAGTFRRASKRVMLLGIVTTLVLLIGAVPFSRYGLDEPDAAPYLLLMAPVPIGIALVRLGGSLLRSKGRILLSQSLDGVAYTGLAALIVAMAVLLGRTDWPLLPAAAYLCSITAVLTVSMWFCHTMIRTWGTSAVALPMAAGWYIAAFNGLSNAGDWTGLMLLTNFDGPASAGIYRVAFQVTMLFTIVNTSFAVMVGPRIAAAGAQQDHLAVRRTVRSAGFLGSLICLPLLVLIMGWAEPVLGLFGGEFVEGALALRILAIGQIVNVAFGPVGAALTMMHQERKVLLIELFAFGLSIASILLLMPTDGMIALAVGSMVASLVRNSASYVTLRRHMAHSQRAVDSSPA